MSTAADQQSSAEPPEDAAGLRERLASAESEVKRLEETLVRVQERERWLMGVVDRLLQREEAEPAGMVAGARLWLWIVLAVVSGGAVALSALRALRLW
jgi:hypothetical protein